MQQLRQARDLAEVAQRSIADAGGWRRAQSPGMRGWRKDVAVAVPWRRPIGSAGLVFTCARVCKHKCNCPRSSAAPACMCECACVCVCARTRAEGRASRAEALLRKVDERKAAAEVERRRASEAAGRLEQEALELRSRLEAAQHRERAAQAEAERLRWAARPDVQAA